MKTVELLAPAGSYESMVASIQGGADAVYLAGNQFGARQFANNFDREEIAQAIQYAHIRGVKVYVTVNTLIKDQEWQALVDYVDFLYASDVDGVIVQDLGVADHIRKHYPDLELHGSTQMSCHHLNDFKFMKDFGFDRVVAGREMSLEAIGQVKQDLDLEIEVFVHGALCVCYSGQCLMSSVIGGRSGNRGRCAQPCRQVYDFNDQSSYALSPKDLKALDRLEALRDIGVDSLKIEGRMKGPEYAYTVAKAYKDRLLARDSIDHLNQIFHRSYTGGLLLGDRNWVDGRAPGNRGEYVGTVVAYDKKAKRLSLKLDKVLVKGDEIQVRYDQTSVGARTDVFYLDGRRVTQYELERPIQVDFKYPVRVGDRVYRTYDAQWMRKARQAYDTEGDLVAIDINLSIREGQPMLMSLTDGQTTIVQASDTPVERALKKPLDQDRVVDQLKKLGQTPYYLRHFQVDLGPGLVVPIKAINHLRRTCIDRLDQKRACRYHREKKRPQQSGLAKRKSRYPRLAVSVLREDQREAVKDLDLILYSKEDTPILDRISSQTYDQAFKAYDDKVLSNHGQVYLYGDVPWLGNYSLNVFNSHTMATYEALGCKRMTLSYELSKKEILGLRGNMDLEMVVYGRVPVMVSQYCPLIKATKACDKCPDLCRDNPGLKDKYGAVFPLLKQEEAMTILSHKPLHLMAYLKDFLPGPIDVFRLDFSLESPQEVRRITLAYMTWLESKKGGLELEASLASHFLKGVE